MSKEFSRTNWKFLIWNAAALVVILAASLWFNRNSSQMTIACSHNPAHHLHARPDRDVLPANVKPIHYDLTITPNMDAFTFEGRVLIRYGSLISSSSF